jgi:hypothetical protein
MWSILSLEEQYNQPEVHVVEKLVYLPKEEGNINLHLEFPKRFRQIITIVF